MPVLKESQFAEKGVLTPEEFVVAGDNLVYKCPTWEWYGESCCLSLGITASGRVTMGVIVAAVMYGALLQVCGRSVLLEAVLAT